MAVMNVPIPAPKRKIPTASQMSILLSNLSEQAREFLHRRVLLQKPNNATLGHYQNRCCQPASSRGKILALPSEHADSKLN